MQKILSSMMATALLLAVSAPAQTGSSLVAGAVADSTNRVIPGASVTLTNEASAEQRTAITNEIGEFVFPAVVPGAYTVRVHAAGFRVLELKGNVVLSSTRLAVGTLRLEVGSVNESVEVTAQTSMVQTDSSEKSELVDLKELQNVSIRGRDPISFLGIMPGVQKGQDPDFLGASYGSTIPAFQGLSTNTNVMMTDGVNGGDSQGGGIYAGTVNLDSIAEVRVLMGNYNAEYGRAGGAIINMITKSGGKDYHGSGWFYKRHEELNANNYFNNLNGLGKSIYRFQTLGGDVGGPVRLPKINLQDKLFFFVLFEDTRLKNPAAIERWTMPTALERQGDFSQSFNGSSLIVVKDPLTGQPFPNNIIPQSRANPYGLAEMNILPMPNYNGAGYNYLFQERFVNQPRQSFSSRVDYHPTDKDTVSVTFKNWGADISGIHVAAAASKWGLAYMTYEFAAYQSTINWTRVITPHLVNEFFVGGLHDKEASPPVGSDCTTNGCGQYNPLKRQNRGALQQLGQFNATWNPYNYVPQASFGGIPTSFSAAAVSFDGREPLSGFDSNLTGKDDLTYTYGPHTFKAGFFFEHSRFGQTATSNFSGNADFGQNSLDPTNTGYAFANAYVGHFNQYTEDLGRGPDNTRHNIMAVYLQDTWKIRRNLTLDIGLRVYRDPWPLQSDGVASIFAASRFDPSWGGNPPALYYPALNGGTRVAVNSLTGGIFPQTYIGDIVPGTGNSCLNLSDTNPCKLNGIVIQNDKTYEPSLGFRDPVGPQWDPRLGVAWDPFGDGKTAVRASIGEFHAAAGSVSGNYDRGPAFVYTRLVLNGTLDPSMFQTIPLTSPISVTGTEKKIKVPTVWQYQLGIQRDIGRNMTASVAYVGNTEHYITENYNYNVQPFGLQFQPQYADPTNTSVPLPQAFLVPNKGYLNLTVSHPAARTRYDSLQTKVTRRFAAGLELDANFTWSKNFNYNNWSQLVPVKNFWGLSAIDQTFVSNFTYVYSIPKVSKLIGSEGRAAKAALDNWQISGITTFASGFPQNITLATTDNFNYTGGGDVSAQVALSCNPQLPSGSRNFSRFLNTSCVQRPAGRGSLGSILNNDEFRGPGFNNFDVSLFKNFPVKETRTLQFRWEVYNILNHAEYAGSAACRDCHKAQHTNWQSTGMGRMFRSYRAEDVIGDFTSGQTVPDDAGKPVARAVLRGGRHYLEIRSGERWKSYPVEYLIGSKWQQGYATRLPGGEIQVFPLQYNTLEKRWVNYWKIIDAADSPRTDITRFHEVVPGATYQLDCAPCHTSQERFQGAVMQAKAASFREGGINCEMCHGPSASHVAALRSGRAYHKDPSEPPVDFRRISAAEYVAICAQCHMQSGERNPEPSGAMNYSASGDKFYRTLSSRPYVDYSRKAFYKDGRFRETVFIVESFVRSACFRKGGATCGACHNPHPDDAASNPTSVKFGADSDRMCLGCHTKFRAQPQAHTHHAAASEASRCVSCHMPRIMNALLFQARSHQIDDIPDAAMAARFGPRESPNACLQCHKDRDAAWLSVVLAAWAKT